MPECKQIHAHVEVGPSNTRLEEYQRKNSDGHVECFIAAPDTDMPFSINLWTEGYIAPGLGFWVFMDGEFQSNRNKLGLKLPVDGVSRDKYEFNLRMRQKEEKTSAGSFVAREWTFAQLQRGAAEKELSMNEDWYRNVGTIEIVVLRCLPISEESAERATDNAYKIRMPRRAALAEPSKKEGTKGCASVAASSAKNDNIFGGMTGIFDGTCGSLSPDDADEEYRCVDTKAAHSPSSSPDQTEEARLEPRANIGDVMAKATLEMQRAQLDGPSEWPHLPAEFYAARYGDDLCGDRYMGMTGQDRSTYWQHFRERGDAITAAPAKIAGTDDPNGFECFTAEAAGQIKAAPSDGKSLARLLVAANVAGTYRDDSTGIGLLEKDLDIVRREFIEMQERKPHVDMAGMWKQWNLMKARLHGKRAMRAAQTQADDSIPDPTAHAESALEEAINYLRGLRTELRRSYEIHAGFDLDLWLEHIRQVEQQMKTDPLWADTGPRDELSNVKARHNLLYQLHDVCSEVWQMLCHIDTRHAHTDLAQKVVAFWEAGKAAKAQRRQLEAISATPGVLQTPKVPPSAPAKHVCFRHGADAPSLLGGSKPASLLGHNFYHQAAAEAQDWQEVGGGSWKPTQQQGSGWNAPKPPSTLRHFAGKNLPIASKWGPTKPQSGLGVAAGDDSGQQANAAGRWLQAGSQRGYQNSWKNDPQQQDGTGWDNAQQNNNSWGSRPASKPASQDQWARADSKQGGDAGWGSNSRRRSQDGSAGHDWGNDGGHGNHWGGQNDKSQPNNSLGKRSNGINAARGSRSSKPEEFIKPYWKDWNKRPDPTAKKREVARDPYTYPMTKLPAIPEGKAVGATHGIQTGRGAEYHHETRTPKYMDTMEKPYAVITIKYRSKDWLNQKLGVPLEILKAEAKFVEVQAHKDKLKMMPKEELIEELMKSQKPKSSNRKAPSAAGGQSWGGRPAHNSGGWDQKSKTLSNAGNVWGGQSNPGGGGREESRKSGANGWNGGGDQIWGEGNNVGWDGSGERLDRDVDRLVKEQPTTPTPAQKTRSVSHMDVPTPATYYKSPHADFGRPAAEFLKHKAYRVPSPADSYKAPYVDFELYTPVQRAPLRTSGFKENRAPATFPYEDLTQPAAAYPKANEYRAAMTPSGYDFPYKDFAQPVLAAPRANVSHAATAPGGYNFSYKDFAQPAPAAPEAKVYRAATTPGGYNFPYKDYTQPTRCTAKPYLKGRSSPATEYYHAGNDPVNPIRRTQADPGPHKPWGEPVDDDGSSIFTDPYGQRWKGNKIIGTKTPPPLSEVRAQVTGGGGLLIGQQDGYGTAGYAGAEYEDAGVLGAAYGGADYEVTGLGGAGYGGAGYSDAGVGGAGAGAASYGVVGNDAADNGAATYGGGAYGGTGHDGAGVSRAVTRWKPPTVEDAQDEMDVWC